LLWTKEKINWILNFIFRICEAVRKFQICRRANWIENKRTVLNIFALLGSYAALIVSYRRFGTTYRFNLHDPWIWGHQVEHKHR
jgi:hypothetical protein